MSIIVAVILLLAISLASSGNLIRNKVVGLLELFFLSNLGILATVLQVNDAPCADITVSISFSFTVFGGTILYHLHQEIKNNSSYTMIKKKMHMVCIIQIKHNTSDEKENVIPEQGSTTTYFQLRENLFDRT